MNSSDVQKSWDFLGVVELDLVLDALSQIRQGFKLVGKTAGDSRSKLKVTWNPNLRALMCSIEDSETAVGLELATLRLRVCGRDEDEAESLELDGKTLEQAQKWLNEILPKRGIELSPSRSKPAGETISQASANTTFSRSNSDAFEEAGRYYANAWRCLMFAGTLGKAPSNVWLTPEHMALDRSMKLENGATLEIVFSPDFGLDERDFHFLVTADPVPAYTENELNELEGGGEWITQGRFGTRLSLEECRFYDAEPMQADAVSMYLESSVDELRRLYTRE